MEPFEKRNMIVYWTVVCILYSTWLLYALWLVRFNIAGINAGLLAVGLLVVHIYISFEQVGAQEIGVKIAFGYPFQNAYSGPTFVFWFLGYVRLETEKKTYTQEEYPGEPEEIDKTDSDTLAPGKVFPMRITHGRPAKDSDDPLDQRMTTEVRGAIRWRIDNLLRFIQTIGDIPAAKRNMRDTMEKTIRIEFARRTPAKTLDDLEALNEILEKNIEKLTEKWGVEIDEVQLTEVDLGKTVNESLRNVPAAQLQAQTVVIAAKAQRKEFEEEGAGIAKARQLLLEAEAFGTKALAGAMSQMKHGELAARLEAMRKALEKGDNKLFLVGGEFNHFMESLTGAINSFKQKPAGSAA